MTLSTHPLPQESKSIGADVNWGVRFRDVKDVSILSHFVSYCYITFTLQSYKKNHSKC